MVFKINLSHKGKAAKFEIDNENLIDKTIGETVSGSDIVPDLAGYELEITGTSDKAGFPGLKNVQGAGLKKVLLKYGIGMHIKPKGLRKKRKKSPEGLKLRKTVRGNTISADTVQINMKVIKEGTKKFEELLPKKEEAVKAA